MKFLSRYEANAYFLLRIVFGFLFMCHGLQKTFLPQLLHGHQVAPGLTVDFLGAVIELVAGLLVFLGLFTRIAAVIASGEMAVAYFMVHAKGGFFPIVNHGELAVAFCWFFLFVLFYGPGRWSVDALLFKRASSTPAMT